MVDVVGLRFITQGEAEARAALQRYQAGLTSLSQLQDKYVAAMNRALREEERATAAAAATRARAAAGYAQLTASMDPAVAASQRFAASQKTIQDALAQGIIRTREANAALARLKAQYEASKAQAFADAQRRISTEIINGNAAVNRINASYQSLTEKIRQNTLTVQQQRAAELALARELATVSGYLKSNGALNTQKALAELRAAQATRDHTAATAAGTQAYARFNAALNSMRAAADPLIAKQMQMRQAHEQVRAALAAGIITRQQAAQSLLQYRAAMNALLTAQNATNMGVNRFGVITQQAGYQVGDFFVQLQSGTNIMVAFGQQATQLVGTFAALARTTKGILLFSGLGVLISVGTAIGAAFMRARAGAKKATDAFAEMSSALSDIEAVRIEKFTDKLAAGARDATLEWRALLGVMREVAQEDLRKQLDAIVQTQIDALSKAVSRAEWGARFTSPANWGSLGDEPVVKIDVLGFSDQESAIQAIQLLRGVTGDTREEIAESLRMTELWLRGSGLLTDEVKQLLAELADAADVQSIIEAKVDAQVDGVQKMQAMYATLRTELEQQAEMLALRARYGEDSLQYLQREAQISMENYARETRARKDLEDADKERLIALNDANTQMEMNIEVAERGAAAARSVWDNVVSALRDSADEYEKAVEAAQEQITLKEREIALNEVILRYGEDSRRVASERRAQALLEIEDYIAQHNLVGALAEQYRAVMIAAYDTSTAVERGMTAMQALLNIANPFVSLLGTAAERMQDVYENSALAPAFMRAASAVDAMNTRLSTTLARLRGILGAIGSIGFDTIALRAETKALEAGASAGQARIEGTLASTEAGMGGMNPIMRGILLRAQRIAMEENLAAQTARDARLDALKDSEGGGSASEKETASLQSVVAEMEKRIERERELLGLFGSARREREIALELEDQLLKAGQNATQEQIAAAAAKIAAEERVNETLKRQQEVISTLASTLENSMTSAFMSIVDGTKTAGDAFRDMAKLIITELYRVLVVQRLVGSYDQKTGSGTGIVGAIIGGISKLFADGAAFSNGAVTPFARGAVMANLNRAPGAKVVPFATGGVVGSPMLFPMSGGRTGLMGEAGPEAIMPLKRGSDGKLGVSTNGAAPVVQIINQIPDAQVMREREIQPNGATLERFTVSRAVASGLTTPGGAGRSTLQQTFGVQPKRTTR